MYIVIKGHKIPPSLLIKPLAGIIFSLFFLAAGIPLAQGIIRMNWPITTGTILDSKIEEVRDYNGYNVRLSYEYLVKDKKYVGRYIHELEDLPFPKEKASKIVKIKYAPYKQVEVYYDLLNPEIAFLEPGPKLGEIIAFILGLFLFIGSITIAYWIITDPVDGVGLEYKKTVTVIERIRTAINTESDDPREALKLYRQAKKKNTDFSILIFITSLFAPILATVLALNSLLISERLGSILSYIIIAYAGFGVPAMLRAFRDRRNGVVSIYAPKELKWFWINAVFAGPFLMFRGLLLIVTGILFSVLIILPLTAMLLLSVDFGFGIIENPYIMTTLDVLAALSGLIILLTLLADVRFSKLLPLVTGVKILFAAIMRNIQEVLEHFSLWSLGYVIVAINLGYPALILTSSLEAMIGGVLSGIFLALALSRGFYSTTVRVIIELGMCRCHIRLQNWGQAELLRPVDSMDISEDIEREDCRKICGYLSNHLMSLLEGIRLGYQPSNLDLNIERANELSEADIPDREIWKMNIRANQLLAEDAAIRSALDRAKKRRSLVERIDFDVCLLLFQWYWGVGIICFVWWLIRVL